MFEDPQSLFARLKRPLAFAQPRIVADDLCFRLNVTSDGRAFAAVEDPRGRPVPDPSHFYYDGPLRQAVKRIEQCRLRGRRLDGTPAPDGAFWLDEDDGLIPAILAAARLIDAKGRPIRRRRGLGRAGVAIEPHGEALACQPVVTLPDGTKATAPQFLSEDWALIDGEALQIHPLGEGYADLARFQTTLAPEDLPQALSLLCSRFETIGIHWQDFRQTQGPMVTARPAVIIEKVGRDGTLYLRVGAASEPLSPAFLAQYRIDRVARLDPEARRISVHELTQPDLAKAIADLRGRLNRLGPEVGRGPGTFFTQDRDLLIIERTLATAFIERELAQVLAQYAVYGARRLARFGVVLLNPAVKLRLSETSQWLLKGGADLDFGAAGRVPLGEALAQLRRRGWLTLSDGSQCMVSQALIERLTRLIAEEPTRIAVSFFDLPALEALWGEDASGPALARARDIYRGFGQLNRLETPPCRLKAELRPFQEIGRRWLWHLRQHQLGGCLADEMGLGKTMQILALLSAIYPAATLPSLIIVPSGLLNHWASEIATFAPQLSAGVYYGPNRNFEQLSGCPVILTTYAMVRRDIAALESSAFECVILDEAQTVKNRATQTAKTMLRLKAKTRLALTGTPIENNLGDLYSLFRFLNPGMFGHPTAFERRFARPIQRENDREAAATLRRIIHPFILRRRKRDVLSELPPKTEQTLRVSMSSAHRRLYEAQRAHHQETVRQAMRQGDQSRVFFLFSSAMTALRQAASIPEAQSQGAVRSHKRRLLLTQLEEIAANGRKALVFANFLDALHWIGIGLQEAGIPFQTLSGKTSDRTTPIARFQQDPAINVLLMTLKVGGVGLNLTQADTVFLFDPWWNRAAERQAEDRVHRIGQNRPVFTYRLIAQGTVEEKIEALQQRKSALLETLLPQDDLWGKKLSEDDIAFLLGA